MSKYIFTILLSATIYAACGASICAADCSGIGQSSSRLACTEAAEQLDGSRRQLRTPSVAIGYIDIFALWVLRTARRPDILGRLYQRGMGCL